MPLPIIRYPLDPTGINRDNLVVGELHTLSTRTIRAAAPKYGAFFTNSLRVYDHSTDQLLNKGTQYQCVELLQDASIRYGKEICLLVLILDPNVSNQIRINYQVLGGHYTNDASGIINLYETAMKDDRPVHWYDGILDKPTEFNPTLHTHLLEDIYGFQPLVSALERIRNALILSDVPAFEALIDWMNVQFADFKFHLTDRNNPHHTTAEQVNLGLVENLPVITETEINIGHASHKYVTFDMLLYALSRLRPTGDFTLNTNVTAVKEGYTVSVLVSTKGIADGTTYYWTVDHIETVDADFATTAGQVMIENDAGAFSVSIRTDAETEITEHFKLVLHADSPDGAIVAITDAIAITDVPPGGPEEEMTMAQLMTTCCVFTPGVKINARSVFVIESNDF